MLGKTTVAASSLMTRIKAARMLAKTTAAQMAAWMITDSSLFLTTTTMAWAARETVA